MELQHIHNSDSGYSNSVQLRALVYACPKKISIHAKKKSKEEEKEREEDQDWTSARKKVG
jgi:hypothetical protein